MLWIILPITLFGSLAFAQDKGWEKEWANLLSAARKEGRVVVSGPADPTTRRELPAKFTARFGIPVEYLVGNPSEVFQKARIERRAGVYSIDVFVSGTQTFGPLYQEKMLDPLKPALLLPEVLDPTKWKKGKPWFMDPEDRYVLRLFSFVSAFFYINTRLAKVEEFKTHMDLLRSKWTGKIVVNDPTVPGRGAFIASVIYSRFGEEFAKKLFIDQRPVMSRDTRQVTDWIARGTYPISLEADDEQVERMKEEGFPMQIIYSLPGQPGAITSAVGQAGILNRAPHPSAARVFANWLASKEGVETFSRARVHASTRNDVGESFLRKDQIPQSGVNYFDASGWEFSTVENNKIRQRMREILKR